jgi:nucleotide-binding universal stress UspA family protein
MFRHILMPVDSSTLSEKTVRTGVRFASEIGARITAFHMTPTLQTLPPVVGAFEATRDEYLEGIAARTHALLQYVRKTANAAGVECDVTSATGSDPSKEIIRAAESKGCDLILMGSHGRRGVEGMLLGSETHKVLTHSTIPVLVYR